MYALETRDVVKAYGSGSSVTKAVDGVSVGVKSGEFVA
jgi:ABC-type oligopeptide transport system ATPase subunit